MKFRVEKSSLLRALAHAQSVVEKRNTVPILSNIMLSARGGIVSLTATDLEIAVIEDVTATISRDGACTVPAATLYEIVRRLPDSAQIEMDHARGDQEMSLRAGRYATKLLVLPVEDFPSMKTSQMTHRFAVAGSVLRGLFERVRFAICTETTRYYLNGVFLHEAQDGDGSVLRVVTTDGHRLAQAQQPLPEGAAGMPGVIVPRKTVAELLKLLDDSSGTVGVSLSDTLIQFQIGGVILTSKLIEGTFPEYERVIPRDNDKSLVVGKKDFSESVARVVAVSTERSRVVKMSLMPGRLVLSSISAEMGSASEEMDGEQISYDSAAMEIGFQSRYLNDVTDLIADKAEFRFGSEGNPITIQDVTDRSTLFVLMPMRV